MFEEIQVRRFDEVFRFSSTKDLFLKPDYLIFIHLQELQEQNSFKLFYFHYNHAI